MDRTWYHQQRETLRRRLKGNLTRLAVQAGVRVTDVAACFLRMEPMPTARAARRLADAYNRLGLTSALYWQDLLDPLNSIHPMFAPLHPEAIRREQIRDTEARRAVK